MSGQFDVRMNLSRLYKVSLEKWSVKPSKSCLFENLDMIARVTLKNELFKFAYESWLLKYYLGFSKMSKVVLLKLSVFDDFHKATAPAFENDVFMQDNCKRCIKSFQEAFFLHGWKFYRKSLFKVCTKCAIRCHRVEMRVCNRQFLASFSARPRQVHT